jgi:hypothetical protein
VCIANYYLNSDVTNSPFCDRCYIGCVTCSGPLATNCLSCATAFKFDANTSSCIAPNTVNDTTVAQIYNFNGFSVLSNWGYNYNSNGGIYQCGSITMLGYLQSGNYIIGSYSQLSTHYQLRVMFAYYFLFTTSVSSQLQVYVDGNNNQQYISRSSNNACGGNSFVVETIDSSYAHSSSSVTLYINNNNGYYFGIREFVLITKLCNTNCASCYGYTSSTCYTCTDPARTANFTNGLSNGTCRCTGSYYQ